MADSNVNKSDLIRGYLGKNPDASAKSIAEALTAQGTPVSVSLAANVKARMQAKGKGKRKARRKVAANGRKTRARRGGTKSQSIRDYIESHPTATPKAIHADLRKSGVKVSQSLISAVKYGKKAARPGRRRTAGGPARGASLSLSDLVDAKKLVDRLGGADAVRKALDALDQLR
jgi:hypothetical protein